MGQTRAKKNRKGREGEEREGGTYVEDSVRIDIEGDLNLGDSSRSGRDAREVELEIKTKGFGSDAREGRREEGKKS